MTMHLQNCSDSDFNSSAKISQSIEESAKFILKMVNDILDFAQQKSSTLIFSEEPFNLKEIILDTCKTTNNNASSKDSFVQVKIDQSIPEKISGDAEQVRKILLSLFENSLKSCQRGIQINIFPTEQQKNKLRICFEINELAFLAPDSNELQAEAGQSILSFELPFPMEANQQSLTAKEKGSRIARILIAEDSTILQKIALSHVRRLGFSGMVVSDGKQALEALQEGNFDLILMDCMMPVLDGYQATMMIRQHEKQTGKHIPIIAVTASDNRLRCFASGMDDYLAKPLDLESLTEKLNKWIDLSQASI